MIEIGLTNELYNFDVDDRAGCRLPMSCVSSSPIVLRTTPTTHKRYTWSLRFDLSFHTLRKFFATTSQLF